MYMSTPNGKLLEGNPAFMELFGYLSRGEFLDANVKNHYLNLKDRENFQKVIKEKGFVKDYKLTLKHRKGKSIAVSITADAQRDKRESSCIQRYYKRYLKTKDY
ncbi:MAG: PAS domain-containing protein [Candidatus Aminicenantia bacterium]